MDINGTSNESLIALLVECKNSPDNVRNLVHLGNMFLQKSNLPAAVLAYQVALNKDSGNLDANLGLGTAYQGLLQYQEALTAFNKALQISPHLPEALTSIGNIYLESGDARTAIEHFERALTHQPGYNLAHSNLLMALLYLQDTLPDSLLKAHQKWGHRYSYVSKTTFDFPNTREISRKLKIGYVSPNFYFHPVSTFFGPMISACNRQQFEIYCYYNNRHKDGVTRQLHSLADHWRDTINLDDDQLEALIRKDEIDILIDLAGHTANNRLPVFAKRVAPVQASYLGYPCTTGLDTMDYYITDKNVDPKGSENHYSEHLVNLPVFSCYQPVPGLSDVSPPPSLSSRYITFASLNNPAKISSNTIALWSSILRRTPNSILIMQGKGFQSKSIIKSFTDKFSMHGVTRNKLVFYPPMPFLQHMQIYNKVDIALDTHPWNGHTTTSHALWMGCPVISMWGNRHVSRMTGGVLTAIGLKNLVASNEEEFVELAVETSKDVEYLKTLRSTMRQRMLSSIYCNQQEFQKHLEAAYRQMWKKWCEDLN